MTTTTGEHWSDRGGFKHHGTIHLDERDTAILDERQQAHTALTGIQEGHVIIFADGVKRYVSHVWEAYTDDDPQYSFPAGAQTSDGGSFHLGRGGYCSFSGSLHPSVPLTTLTRTEETATITVWFFHHDWAKANNGIDVPLTVPVWHCTRRSDER